MKLRVELISDSDPEVFDVESGENITDRVISIELLPRRSAQVAVRNQDTGKFIHDVENDCLLTEKYMVVEVIGRWLHRGYTA